MNQPSSPTSGVDPGDVIKEVNYLYSLMASGPPKPPFNPVYRDVVALFKGKYPGFRPSNTKYHNLEHTGMVVLAAVRLMHGCFLNGHKFIPENFFLGFAAALFHDVGLIQAETEQEGTGAVFTVGHEERSIAFMSRYLAQKNFSQQLIDDCAALIRCTILGIRIKEISFRTEEIKILGKIVGSADLLGQMADRCYLEKLLLLYKEFEEARLPGFDSELDLLQKTEAFYTAIARKRLLDDFGNIAASMRLHFKDRLQADRDLYAEAVASNIDYLKSLIVKCNGNYACYLKNLRRGGIVHSNYPELMQES